MILLSLNGCYLPNSRDNAIDRKAKITTLAMVGSGITVQQFLYKNPSNVIRKLPITGRKGAFFTGAGASLGSLYGLDELKKLIDKHDLSFITTHTLQSLEKTDIPNQQTYENPETGVKSTITTHRTFVNDDGNICREFDETLEVQNQSVTKSRTACQNTAGFWSVF